jgi:DNA-binding response OmpR family regulator
MHVWLPRGRAVALDRRPVLWRLLEVLLGRGGKATKEELVEDVWSEPYHPLRHDNRLRLAVRKLRKLVEDDAAHPTRVITTADGYALRGTVRRSRSVQPHAP